MMIMMMIDQKSFAAIQGSMIHSNAVCASKSRAEISTSQCLRLGRNYQIQER